MRWGGNLFEFSRPASKEESFSIIGILNRPKGRGGECPGPGGLSSSPFRGRRRGAPISMPMNSGSGGRDGDLPRQSMASNSRAAAAQARKSASGSIVIERLDGGDRSGRSQSLRCRRIFSMTLGQPIFPGRTIRISPEKPAARGLA
jgi:hypothetical protein